MAFTLHSYKAINCKKNLQLAWARGKKYNQNWISFKERQKIFPYRFLDFFWLPFRIFPSPYTAQIHHFFILFNLHILRKKPVIIHTFMMTIKARKTCESCIYHERKKSKLVVLNRQWIFLWHPHHQTLTLAL